MCFNLPFALEKVLARKFKEKIMEFRVFCLDSGQM